jgi:hypothetical protein
VLDATEMSKDLQAGGMLPIDRRLKRALYALYSSRPRIIAMGESTNMIEAALRPQRIEGKFERASITFQPCPFFTRVN